MDKSTAASNAVRLINLANDNLDLRPSMIKAVCSYFDLMKDEVLSQADRLFMHYLANQAGLPFQKAGFLHRNRSFPYSERT